MVSNLGFIDCAHYIAAQGAPPSGGQPGTTIEINSPVTGCFDASQKKFVIAHELGHTIGFRHTNWAALGEPRDPAGANLIPGTPTTDNASIMNGNTGGSSWNGFSNYDKLAAFRLYPPPMPIVSVTYPGGVPTLSWTALPDGPQYRVTLSDYYSFWYEPAQDYESTSSSYPGDWTTGTSATSFGTYTGFSECHVGNREPGAYDQVDTFILEVRYPIADLDPTLVPAEVVSCQ